MNLRNIEFLIEEALTGIWRNGLMAFASISTIALSLGVLGAFALCMMSANNFMAAQIGQFEIAVFTNVEASNKDAENLAETIRKIDGIRDVTIRDRDEEWAILKRDRIDINSAGLQSNPLPYTLDVKVTDPKRLAFLSTKILALDGVGKVNGGQEEVRRVMAFGYAVRAISIIGMVVLLITTAFIISNAIRLTLYARRREIRIMQLVGATNQTIRIPLVIEGIVFGAAGAFVAWVLLKLGGGYLAQSAQKITPMLSKFSSGLDTVQLAFFLAVLGVAIGAAGSLVSIRRFLKD